MDKDNAPFPPFLLFGRDEPEPEAPSNVVGFPRQTAAMEKLRRMRRCLERCEHNIANDDPNSTDTTERVRAMVSVDMLEVWQDEVRRAEAEVATWEASDVLTFNGRAYRATLSPAGAN